MNPDGRVKLRIGRAHHRGHGAPGGEAGNKYARGIDVIFSNNLVGDARR